MITLHSEISTIGGWSTIYRIKGNPTRCAKVLAPHRAYRNGFPDPAMIARKKYGIKDMLKYELDNHRKILAKVPQKMRNNFVTIHGIKNTSSGDRALVMDLVTDDTGKIAKNLDANTRPLNPGFFLTLERIRREVFLRHSLDHFGIACRNILVRTPKSPVIIDFQNTRIRYRGQFWLRIPYFVRQKVTRKFQRVYNDLGVPDFTKVKSLQKIPNRD